MALLLAFLPAASFAGAPAGLFRIGTGGSTGVYYPVGKLIAQGLNPIPGADAAAFDGEQGVPGIVSVAQNSAGSVENARAVASGEIEAGLVQADVAARAHHAEGEFAGDADAHRLRALASLYPEKLQIVTRRDAGIHRVEDFRGKRISIDELGSGTLAVIRIVLAAHGLSEADFSPVYLKPVFTHDRMLSGELQGFVMMAGAPMDAVLRLADIGLYLVPVAPETAARINSGYPYLVAGTIDAGVYPGVPETPTIQVHALLVVSDLLDEELAYRATACLWSERTRRLLATGHPQGRAIVRETALKGLSLPLHPGAERFYREQGMRP